MAYARNFSAKIDILNETDRPRTIWLEPWAEDFTILPKQRLEIVAFSDSQQPWFGVWEHLDSTQISLEGVATPDYEVFQDGLRVECGHQRQAAQDAGVW